jgi:hypothetical protein
MRHEEKHPSLTPLRALALLRKVGDEGQTPSSWLVNEVKEALTHHVAHAVVRGNRRKSEAAKKEPKPKGRR